MSLKRFIHHLSAGPCSDIEVFDYRNESLCLQVCYYQKAEDIAGQHGRLHLGTTGATESDPECIHEYFLESCAKSV
jgi:hypothetical protein